LPERSFKAGGTLNGRSNSCSGVQGLDLYHPFSTIVSPSVFFKKTFGGGDDEFYKIAI
jgi:hypothetical protein